jgi:uncharacterized protein (TIGR02444 family)
VDERWIVSFEIGCVADILQQKMNTAHDMQNSDHGLWGFSLAFYDRPGVAAALIALQDDAGLDVNLTLFALWLGLSGRGRLDRAALDAAEREIGTLHGKVILPLRALRRGLKRAADGDIQRLRDRIKELEIEAEHMAQRRLAAHAGPVTRAEGGERLADAVTNLALCLGPQAAGAAVAVLRTELEHFAMAALSPPQPVRPSV